MNKHITLLTDYRDQFYFSTRYRGACVDIEKLKKYFEESGYRFKIKNFSEIDLRKENYENEFILYQSSEDPDLLYKDYIEDILLALKLQGAILIPDFKYFRAHHNKVFIELLRDVLNIDEIKNIKSKVFGTFEEYKNSDNYKSLDAFLIKPGSGTRSRGVKLLDTASKKKSIPFKTSRSFTFENFKLLISKLKTGKPYTPMSNNRKKFIVQTFIPNLNGDYRVLVYGEKFYVVYRENRDNDFTASGSGKLNFEADIPNGLLDFAKLIYTKFITPYMSLDIGHLNGKFFLFEFQCLCLGQYTLEKSKFYYRQSSGSWEKVYETPNLEREITVSVIRHVERINSKINNFVKFNNVVPVEAKIP